MFGFRFQWFDYIATFLIPTAIFSLLWLVDFESLLIAIGFTLAGPANHEDIGLALALITLSVIVACSLGLVKIRKSNREMTARILFYIMLISACVFWQNLYDLFSRLGLEVFV